MGLPPKVMRKKFLKQENLMDNNHASYGIIILGQNLFQNQEIVGQN